MSEPEQQSVTNSKMSKRNARSEIGSGRLNVFQVLNGWDEWLIRDPHSYFYVQCSIFIQLMQFTAFAFAPHYSYNAEVAKQLSYFTAAFTIPFWDTSFGQVDLYYFFIIIGVLLAALIGVSGIFIGYVTKAIEQRKGLLDRITLTVGQLLATALFLPALHSFMAPMICDGDFVANFPESDCHGTAHVAAIVSCSIGIILLLAWGGVLTAMLGDHDPTSNQLLATAHNYTDVIAFGFTSFLVIMQHILIPYDQSGVFSLLLIIVSVGMMYLNAYVLPNYHLGITSVRCAMYSVAILGGVVNMITAYADEWFVHADINSLVFLAMAPFAAMIGYAVATQRISREFDFRFNNLHQNAQVHKHQGRYPFPKGLMAKELRFVKKRYRTLENDILNEFEELDATEDRDPEAMWERQISLCSEVLAPTIERVSISSDPEVAVRFLEKHRRVTSLEPSGQLLAFAIRIYTKSMVLFRRSGLVRYSFANFLFKYASKLHVALELIEEVEYEVGGQHDAMILFAAFKLGVRVKELFGMRDSSLLRTFTRAKQLHRDSLTMMTAFWAKLMDNRGDLVGLAQLANSLTDRRKLATVEYTRALADRTDRLLLTLYASFLENVLMNATKAQEFREIADDIAEAKKNSLMRGSRRKAGGGPNLANMVVDDDDDNEEGVPSSVGANHGLLKSLVYIVLVVILCSIASFVLQVVRDGNEQRHVDQVATVSNVKASAERVVGKMLAVNRLRQNCGTGTCEDRTFVQTLFGLSGEDVSLRSQHNKYTYGTSRSSTSPVYQYLRSLTVPVFTAEESPMYTAAVQSREADPLSSGGGSGAVSDDPVAQQYRLGSDGYNAGIWADLHLYNTWTVVHKLSTHISQYINYILENGNYWVPFAIVQDMTVDETVADAINNVIIVEDHETSDFATIFLNVNIGIFVLTLLLVFIAYSFFSAHMRQLALNKATTLGLFTLIPYPTQEMLHNAAKKKVEQFEHSHEEREDEQDDIDDQNIDDIAPIEQKAQSPHQQDDMRRASASGEGRKKSSLSLEESRNGSGQARLINAVRAVVTMGALSNALSSAANSDDPEDDHKRKMSRFFGARPMSAQGAPRGPPVIRSILKKPKTAAQRAQEKKEKEEREQEAQQKPGRRARISSNVKKVRFNLGADEEKKLQEHKQARRLKEPTVSLDLNEEELINDLNQSMKLADEEERAVLERQKQKHEQEMNKLIHGGLRHSEHARQRRHQGGSGRGDDAAAARTFTIENFTRLLGTLCLLITAALCIVIYVDHGTLHTTATQLIEREAAIFGTKTHVEQLTSLATAFSHFGRTETYHSYFNLLKTNRHTNIIDLFNYQPEDLDQTLVQRLANVEARAKRVMGGDMISMSMSSRAMADIPSYGLSVNQVPLVAAFSWRKDQLSAKLADEYPTAVDKPSEFIFPDLYELQQREVPSAAFVTGYSTNNTVVPDAASLNISDPLTATDLHAFARRRLHSKRTEQDKKFFFYALNDTFQRHKATFFDESDGIDKQVEVLLVVAVVSGIFTVLGNLGELFYTVKAIKPTFQQLEFSRWKEAVNLYWVCALLSHIFVAIFTFVGVVYLGLAINAHATSGPTPEIANLLTEADDITSSFMERRTLVSSYISGATPLVAFTVHTYFSDISGRLTALHDAVLKAKLSLPVSKAGLIEPILRYEHLQKVGMFIAFTAANNRQSPSSAEQNEFGFISAYDMTEEPNYDRDSTLYTTDFPNLHYSTNQADLLPGAHSLAELSDMARFAVFGRRGVTAMKDAEDMLRLVSTSIESEGKKRIGNYFEELENESIVAMALVLVSVGIYFFLFVLPKILEVLRGQEESPTTEKRAAEMIEALYVKTIRKVRLSLVVIFVLIIVQFILIALTTSTGHDAVKVISTAFGREYHVSRAGTAAERLLRAVGDDSFVEVSTILSELGEIEKDLANAYNDLYRSPDSSSTRYGHVTTLSDEQNKVTFDETTGMDRAYQSFSKSLRDLSVSELSLETSRTFAIQAAAKAYADSDNGKTTPAARFYTYRPLTDPTKIDATVKATITAVALTITDAVDALILDLKRSNDVHLNDAQSSLSQRLVPDIIIMVCVILIGLLEIRFVFIPIANVVQTEQQGTMVMLRMIPPSVREMVPKIQMYLESGVLVNEHAEKQAYSRSLLVNNFVRKWQNGGSESSCYSMFNNHTNGIIIIDVKGTVTYINDEITAILEFTKKDMVGKNIKMIVDEPLRSLHDGFLRRFVQQGTSRIVGGGRDVLALNKQGAHVHIYLDLYEAARHTGEIYFVGEIRRYDWQVAMGGKDAAKRMLELQAEAQHHRESLAASGSLS